VSQERSLREGDRKVPAHPKPSRHARKRKSEREAGSHAAAAARADPPVNTRRGAVEGGSGLAASE